jgi:putative ABC transport system substrate-binding protein
MSICLRRREFIAGLGSAAAWPLAASAQQGDRVRRIGVLMSLDENDPEEKTFVSAFTQALAGLGWTDGRNVRLDLRGGALTSIGYERSRRKVVGLQPDITLANATAVREGLNDFGTKKFCNRVEPFRP